LTEIFPERRGREGREKHHIRRLKFKDADSSLAAGAFAVEVVCPMAISNIDKQGLVSRHVAPRLPNYTTPCIWYKRIGEQYKAVAHAQR
jgi:hypothetical protein